MKTLSPQRRLTVEEMQTVTGGCHTEVRSVLDSIVPREDGTPHYTYTQTEEFVECFDTNCPVFGQGGGNTWGFFDQNGTSGGGSSTTSVIDAIENDPRVESLPDLPESLLTFALRSDPASASLFLALLNKQGTTITYNPNKNGMSIVPAVISNGSISFTLQIGNLVGNPSTGSLMSIPQIISSISHELGHFNRLQTSGLTQLLQSSSVSENVKVYEFSLEEAKGVLDSIDALRRTANVEFLESQWRSYGTTWANIQQYYDAYQSSTSAADYNTLIEEIRKNYLKAPSSRSNSGQTNEQYLRGIY